MSNGAPQSGEGRPAPLIAPARMIALGSAALMEGFALIGFETHVNPAPEEIEKLMRDLLRMQQAALVVIEQSFARNPGRYLMRAQNEGGRIVITEIPELGLPENYHSRVETLVQQVMGAEALEVKK
jgi:vacuolar-type H+-ATPase subunit F/Vma7